jgi:DNA-binding MarR family transcriptional regulator
MIDQNNSKELRAAAELFFFAYRAFTSRPDQLLAERGLGRVHHRILYFVGRHPRIAVSALLGVLGVSKQALNAPLRQLIEMQLVAVEAGEHDRRVKQLSLTESGQQLEDELTSIQTQHLAAAFAQAGITAEAGWRQAMQAILDTA